jgi:hypothetical protein
MKYTIEDKTIEIFLKNTSELKPYEKNARTHPKKQIELLKENIRAFGYTAPIVIDKEFNIIAGHGRLEALKQLKVEEVPCVYIDYLNEKQIKALRLADNKLQEMSEWDMDIVIPELKDLDEDLLNLTGLGNILSQEERKYTDKIQSPVYEPSGLMPNIEDLYSDEKTIYLIEKIEKLKIDERTKKFLINAAHRFTVFNFEEIANFYAHNEDIKEIMEEMALVVVDFNSAVENGFVVLEDSLIKIMHEEENG